MEDFTYAQARGLVLARQGLSGPRLGSIAEATGAIVGAFGSAPTCYLTLAARVEGFRRADLDRELYERRSLVRVRAMHEMNFALPVEDLPVILAATQAGGPKVQARLLRLLGLTEEEYERLSAAVLDVLADVPSATSAELRGRLPDPPKELSTLIALMGRQCRLVRAEVRGGWRSDNYAYAAWDSWTGTAPAPREPEAARAELARRYLRAFGPATAADLKWWAGWTVRDTKAALAALELTEITLEGDPVLVLTEDLPALAAARPAEGVRLLPYWDALMMGYALPARAPRLVPPGHHSHVYDKSGNGTSVILVDGVAAGVWDFEETRDALLVRAALFAPAPALLPALEAEALRLAEAVGAPRLVLEHAPPPSALSASSARNAFMAPVRLGA